MLRALNEQWASPIVQLLKNPPAMQETPVQSLCREDPLEKGTATHSSILGLPWSTCNAGDPGSIPGLGKSPGEGNGNPLQYSFLENSMDKEPGGLQFMGSQKSWDRTE